MTVCKRLQFGLLALATVFLVMHQLRYVELSLMPADFLEQLDLPSSRTDETADASNDGDSQDDAPEEGLRDLSSIDDGQENVESENIVSERIPIEDEPIHGDATTPLSLAIMDLDELRTPPQYLTLQSSIPQNSKYAYAFIYFGINPAKSVKYRYQISHIVISAQLYRNVYGSKADIIFAACLSHETNDTRLPPEDEALLEYYGVRLFYVDKLEFTDPELDFPKGTIYRQMLKKFWIYQLPETYRKVMYVDTDLVIMRNMDYLMEWADTGILKPMVLLGGYTEPANGGLFVFQPSQEAFTYMWNKFYVMAKKNQLSPKMPSWDKHNGWGVPFENGDMWTTNRLGTNGTEWDFFAAQADQGFMYYYCRYVMRNCTQVMSRQIEIHEPSVDGTSTVTRLLPWDDSPFHDQMDSNVKHFTFSSGSPKCSLFTGGRCVSPWYDFVHWTAETKAWRQGFPVDPEKIRTQPPNNVVALWWHMFFRTKEEQGSKYNSWFRPILPSGYPNDWTISLDTDGKRHRHEKWGYAWPEEPLSYEPESATDGPPQPTTAKFDNPPQPATAKDTTDLPTRIQPGDEDCPFRDSPIYRKVYVYPNPGEVDKGWEGEMLSEYGERNKHNMSWTFLEIDERARRMYTAHYDLNSNHVQYTTELIVRELFTNPKSCLRTYDPEEATLFWVPYLMSAEYHMAKSGGYDHNYETSQYGQALLDIVDEGNHTGWEESFGLTSKWWKRRDGADHILVYSEPFHGLYHPRAQRGHFHYLHTQRHRTAPIAVFKGMSKTFMNEYPRCTRKNIFLPNPNADGNWFNGHYQQESLKTAEKLALTHHNASLPSEPNTQQKVISQFYSAGLHGQCYRLRVNLEKDFKCSPSYQLLNNEMANVVADPKAGFTSGMYLSTFCPCPGGDEPSGKRFFDALFADCIPLVMSEDMLWPFSTEVGQKTLNPSDFSIRLKTSDFCFGALNETTCERKDPDDERSSKRSIQDFLETIPASEIERLRQGIQEAKKVYSWYEYDESLPADLIREHVLPSGGAAHAFIELLAERAEGVLWPECKREAEKNINNREVNKWFC